MAPKPKKPGLTVAIGMGKPKPDDLGEPDSLDKPPTPDPADEAEDATDSAGVGDLLSGMTQPLIDAGLSDVDAKTMLADILTAAAKCLTGDGQAQEEAAAPAEETYGR